MILKSLLLTISLLLTACNAPLEERHGVGSYDNASSIGNDSSETQDPSNSNPTGSYGNSGDGQVQDLGPGFQGCVTDAQHYVNGIGPLGLCQNSINKKSFAIFFEDAAFNMNDATCFIPTYRNQTGLSVPLGMAQCTMHNSGDTKQAYLATNSPSQINGVMVMKYASVNAYFGCMQAYQGVYNIKYQQYMQSCGLAPQICQSNARNYANQEAGIEQESRCGTFKQNHAYLDITLPPL